MSIHAISWVIQNSGARLGDFIVELMIADSTRPDGTGAWPSVATLANKCRMSERQVQRAIQRLVAMGELDREQKGDRVDYSIRRMYAEVNPRCWYCGIVMGHGLSTIDHKTPLCRGGTHAKDNLAPACSRCNSMKGTKTAEEFREFLGGTAFYGESGTSLDLWGDKLSEGRQIRPEGVTNRAKKEPKMSPNPSLSVLGSLKEENTSAQWPSPQALIAMFNEQCPKGISRVTEISEGRLKKARAYLKMFPNQSFWQRAFQEIGKSEFLLGRKNGTGHASFRADFDWLLSKGKDQTENVIKVVEGKYRGQTSSTQGINEKWARRTEK